MFNNKKPKKAEPLVLQATKFAGVKTEAFFDEAKKVSEQYHYCIFSQNINALPMKKMEEQCYYRTADQINRDLSSGIRRSVDMLNLEKFRVCDYDNKLRFTVGSLSYECLFYVRGKFSNGSVVNTFEERRLGVFTFINEPRLGWILASYDDFGPK